jgi:acid phosphatase family membrane protein YuiD
MTNEFDHSPPGPTVSTTQARAGVTGHNVRYVLVGGIVGVVVAFAVIYVIFFGRAG